MLDLHLPTLQLGIKFLKQITDWIPVDPSDPSDELFDWKRNEILNAYTSFSNCYHWLLDNNFEESRTAESNVQVYLDTVKHIIPVVKQFYDLQCETIYERDNSLYESDDVAKFINDLLENLKDLLRIKDHEVLPVKKQIEELEKKLTYWRDLAPYTARLSKEGAELKNLMIHIRAVTCNAAILFYLCLVEEMDESKALEINIKLSDLLLKTKPSNLEVGQKYNRAFKSLQPSDSSRTDQFVVASLIDYLLLDMKVLLIDNATFMAPVKDQTEILHEEMIALKFSIMDPLAQYKTEKSKCVLRNIDEVICEAGSIIYSFSAEVTLENTAMEMNNALSDLLKCIKLVHSDVRKINLFNFPSTDELRCIDYILENMKEFPIRASDLTVDIKHQFERIHKELKYLRSFLGKIKERYTEDEELKELWKRVVVVAYRAEFCIDSFVVGSGISGNHVLQFRAIIQEIKSIKTKVKKTYSKNAPDEDDEVVVGVDDEVQALLQRLFIASKKRDVVAIAGMPGLGKTTIAKKLYNDPSVKQHFDVRAWCCVSQTYQTKDLLLDILGDVIELTDEMHEMSEIELAAMLCKSLKGQRYLVVLDDIWETGAWNSLIQSFPDDKNKSRILITSRMHDLCFQITPGGYVHSLRLFNDDESFMLLEKKVFHEEMFPKKLSDAGHRIAKNCKGLPMAVVLAAGLLSKMEKKKSQWKQFAVSLSEHILKDPNNQCMAILELSYVHLPDYLKSCFLYFGAFPKDHKISVKKLTWLWICEGFVENTTAERLEDVAERYLMELISRSLVIGSKSKCKTKVKKCRIHDLLRDFCLEKSREENFLHHVSGLSKTTKKKSL